MPAYKKDVWIEITPEMFQQIVTKIKNKHQRICMELIYLTGARPGELVLVKATDVLVDAYGDINIHIPTLKNGVDRILVFDRKETPYIEDILAYAEERVKGEFFRLLPFRSPNTVEWMIGKYSDQKLMAYTFRHNRLTQLAKLRANIWELRAYKGSKSIKSVEPYVSRGTDMTSKMKNLIR